MSQKTFTVPNITCGHCVKTIEREVGEIDGVVAVKADESTKKVTVEWSEPEASWEAIDAVLREIDYPPETP
jgi:copper ion binding protein